MAWKPWKPWVIQQYGEGPSTMTMTKNALEIIANRPYTQPGETVDQMWARIATHIASGEVTEADRMIWRAKFHDIMATLRFIPNTPTIAYAGIEGDQHCLSACFVDSPDDSLADIVRVGTETPFIESSGGGIGWGLSKLRPANDKVGHKTGGACGPVRVLHWYSSGGMIFTQGIIRQGAHMAQLHVSHPDILDFIKCKDQCLTPSDPLANVNISVQLTDEFMEAVRTDTRWYLINPRTGLPVGSLQARRVWDAICESAWRTGDPGVVFMDRVHEAAPNSSLPPIQSSNPCGEEFLEDGGSCNLGSLNLTKYVFLPHQDGYQGVGENVDWSQLGKDIYTAIRFLDDVIEVNVFPFPHLAEMNKNTRRVGLGVMGWADMLVMLGLRYDSEEALDLAVRLSGFITDKAWEASRDLATEKGAFPLNTPAARGHDHHVRNSSVTTIAPTGSISIIAGVSSGIEPHFDLMWERKAIWTYDGGSMSTLVELPAPLRQAISKAVDLDYEGAEDALDAYLVKQDEDENGQPDWMWELLGPEVMDLYRTSHQVSPEYHVRMQAAWQAGGRTTNGVSKTVNLPNHATVEDISNALMLAWELKCKAVTVYRDGSKETQVLKGMGVTGTDQVQVQAPEGIEKQRLEFRRGVELGQQQGEAGVSGKRPRSYQGETVQVETGHGPWFFTVNRDPQGEVLEVFLVPGGDNACIRAGATIVGRLLSTALRSGVSLESVKSQLRGIDCGHGTWEDGKFITSVYAALAMVLDASEQAPDKAEVWDKLPGWEGPAHPPFWATQGKGGLCPACGQEAMFHRGGCLQCMSCGHNTCE